MKLKVSRETVERLKKELGIAQRLNNLRLYKIVKALLLIYEEEPAENIARLLGVTVRTVFNWLKRFMWERFSWPGRMHSKGKGRKPKLNGEQKRKLYRIVEGGPGKYGSDCGIWNSAMILIVIRKEFNVTCNPRYVSTLLKSIGLTCQKAKFVSDRSDDEKHRRKRKQRDEETWPEILEKADEMKGGILFTDEVSFARWGSLARTWAPKGKQPVVKTCGKRKGLKMFGAVEFRGGGFVYEECDGKFNGDSYMKFLKQVLSGCCCPVFLIEDGAPYHRRKDVNEFRKEMEIRKRMFVYILPSYSPDKNPIEKLWKNTKRDATHLKYFPTFDDLRSAVVGAFEKYLTDATKVICVMKKLRKKAGIA
ncbi:IS630 family transposase [Desulfonema magnum]|uniref:Transposase DDE domain-containing protein n=1 Tax=Desulfonema magnum TaxID=45655 RepID=A0A975BL80_9BACT|nr:IS630 family transposase [Desulfonema magnum]QTA87607.1 Transposase DDE domain-containing protein [Desulfonema magnum]